MKRGVQAASPGTYVGRRYRYLIVLRKQVCAAHGYGLMTVCEDNQKPIHKGKFQYYN